MYVAASVPVADRGGHIREALALVDEIAKFRMPRIFRAGEERTCLVIPFLRVVLVVGRDARALRAFLRGCIVAKNAGPAGRHLNKVLFMGVRLAEVVPRGLLPRTRLSCKFDVIWWRKGIRVRLVDLGEGNIVDVSVGGAQSFLMKEVEARKLVKGSLELPELLDYEPEGGYLVQKLVSGGSVLSRLEQVQDLAGLLNDVLERLETLYCETQRRVRTGPYIGSLIEVLEEGGDPLREVVEEAQRWLDSGCGGDDHLILVRAHGDLNLGNILVDDTLRQLYLIDWERSQEYSLLHDYHNLQLFLRHVHKIARDKFEGRVHPGSRLAAEVLATKASRAIYARVFFLERLAAWVVYPRRDEKWLRTMLRAMSKQRVNDAW